MLHSVEHPVRVLRAGAPRVHADRRVRHVEVRVEAELGYCGVDLEAEEEFLRRRARLERERVGVVVGGAGGAPRPHGGEEAERVAMKRGGGERADEDVEADGGGAAAIEGAGRVEHGVGRGERGAGGVGLGELDAGGRRGGVGRVEQQEEARVRGAQRREVSGRAAGGHEAEEGVDVASRGQGAPRRVHEVQVNALASDAPHPEFGVWL